MANSVDPDEMANYERCLQTYLYWSVGMKGWRTLITDISEISLDPKPAPTPWNGEV